ncbi:MAG: DUF4169 family protein [Parvibaculaceae bacterium]|nr:DUF4169 family protein [Parvibaculaceae bacterium]|tara:strand:- start:1049 stop:1291 length:243 start_codon:yes stop_codon:yes gene_type:complete
MDSKGKNIVDFGSARKNLKNKKKADQRASKEKQAEENRVKFGRTKAEKSRDKQAKHQNQKRHDGSKIEPLFPAPSQDPKE